MSTSSLPPWDPDEWDRRIRDLRKQERREHRTVQPSPIPPADQKKILGYALRDEPNPTQLLGRKRRKKEAD